MRIQLQSKKNKRVMLLRTIPGVGPVTASAIVATVGDAKQFNNGRQFAARLGPTPLNISSGGKERLSRISKILVVVSDAELFIGNALMVIEWADQRISARLPLRNWGIVWGGNFAGAMIVAILVVLAGL